MSEMVERVARALCEDCGLDWSTASQDSWMRQARAAIAAIEPELQRILSALADIGGAGDMDEKTRRAKAARIYAEMRPIIDAAIDGSQPTKPD